MMVECICFGWYRSEWWWWNAYILDDIRVNSDGGTHIFWMISKWMVMVECIFFEWWCIFASFDILPALPLQCSECTSVDLQILMHLQSMYCKLYPQFLYCNLYDQSMYCKLYPQFCIVNCIPNICLVNCIPNFCIAICIPNICIVCKLHPFSNATWAT